MPGPSRTGRGRECERARTRTETETEAGTSARPVRTDGGDPLDGAEAALSELDAARAALADAEREIEAAAGDADEETIEAVAGTAERAERLFARYEETATGTGRETFRNYLEFQDEFAALVEDVDDDLVGAEAFEEAEELLDQRTLREHHFDEAREALAPARRFRELLNRREEARARVRDAETDARTARRALETHVEELERLAALGEADLDAPVDRLREPVAAYDDAVREAFETFKRTASARELLAFVGTTESYPLVEFRRPPTELREYVESRPAGTEPVSTLLEYADYSTSKLEHYVDDPGALRARVGTHRTYLQRLDGEPLTVGWPPPAAGTLRRRAEELVSVVGRFAEEAVVARLREVRALATEPEYERLRTAAVARTEVGEAERERIRSGAVETDLERAETLLERLDEALDGT